MPCICGQKVDRQDNNKLTCILCKQFAHIKCYKIKQSEIDLIKNAFKCKQCLGARRLSISSSPNSATLSLSSDATSVDLGVNEGLASADAAVKFRSSPLSVPALDVIVAKETVIKRDVGTNTMPVNLCPTSSATLDSILSELTALRSVVVSLRDDNINLSRKVSDLQITVNDLPDRLSNAAAQKCSICGNEKDIISPFASSLSVVSNNACKSADKAVLVPKTYAAVSKSAKTGISANTSISSFDVALAPSGPKNVRSTVTASSSSNTVSSDYSYNNSPCDVVVLDNAVKVSNNVASANGSTNDAWQKVRKKKQQKVITVGKCESSNLKPVLRKKWVHLSSFESSTSAEDITNHIANSLNIDKKHLACYSLLKLGTKPEDVSRINFKLGISISHYDAVISPNIWPCDVTLREFRFFQRDVNIDPGQ